MERKKLDEILEKHQKWLDGDPDGERANLRRADLQGANLFNTCLPLWCGGLNIKLDRLQMAQLAYHFCSMDCEDDEIKGLQKYLYKFANKFADSRDDLKNRKYEVDNE